VGSRDARTLFESATRRRRRRRRRRGIEKLQVKRKY